MKFFTEEYFDKSRSCLKKAAAAGASAVSLAMNYSDKYGCSFEAGRLKQSSVSQKWGYALELVCQGRRSSVTGNSLDYLDDMLKRALDFARIGAVSHYDELPAPGEYAAVKQYDEKVDALSREKLIGDCRNMVETLKSDDGGLDIGAGGSRVYQEGFVMNSAGLFKKEQASSWSLELGFTKVDGQDMLFAGEGRQWRRFNDLYDPEYLIRQNRFDYRHGSRLAAIDNGAYPVLLSPEMFARFLEPVLDGLSGKEVFKEISPLKDKLGKKAFAANLTVIDDPHHDYAPWASAMDDQGIPTRECPLIENGVVKQFLYDYDTACLAGQKPTGHSECQAVGPTVRPGEVSADQLLRSIKKGLYIKSLLGFGQGNIGNGDFSCNVALGYLVEDGEIVGRVKNTMIAGNIFALLNQELQISSDVDPATFIPHVLLQGVQVASKH